jgi:hypothetical protein
VSPFVKSMRIPSPFLGPGKSAFVLIGNPKGPIAFDFDEFDNALHEIRASECDGGVDGGVSSSSDDERDSTQEEVSEMREGVREIGKLEAGDKDGFMVGKVVVLL